MNTPQDGMGCTADFTLDDVLFVTIPPTPPLCTGVPPSGVDISGPANGLRSDVFSDAAPGLSEPAVRLAPAKPGAVEHVIGLAANPGVPTDAANDTVDVGLKFDTCIDASLYGGVEFHRRAISAAAQTRARHRRGSTAKGSSHLGRLRRTRAHALSARRDR